MRSIDAAKFQGQQEGERHKTLCAYLAEVLAFDSFTRDAGISFRQYIKLDNDRYAYPDVFTSVWQGSPAAFELQLSTTHMPVIERRERFYKDAGIRLVWIVGYQDERLDRRAFRDIHMRNDGQILGIDDETLTIARRAGEPHFRLYRLLPGIADAGFPALWRHRIVHADEIDWGRPGDRPRSAQCSYDRYLDKKIEKDEMLATQRRNFYDALEDEDGAKAKAVWNKVAARVGGMQWDALPSAYDSLRALGVLATVRTGKKCVQTKLPLEELPQIINTMLLEPTARRCWTHAFELLSRSLGRNDLLCIQSIREKCERNRAENLVHMPVDRFLGPVFNVFFPEGAFYRLGATLEM